ncbi:MAG: peptide chain release factor N(5)-glutamine methyltransferase [Chitinophagaceae bacterium]|nr:peptide chain release factor N(5)-glutamine methyltransferase [Chitinophagaceae bacterium]
MTSKHAFELLKNELASLYEKREAENIADWVLENIMQEKRWERNRNLSPMTQSQQELFEKYRKELLNFRPVQYVLHEAFFYGMKFFVDENVLIPRPETEELVDHVIKENPTAKSILDIGTGSGCIPVALKKKISSAEVSAVDVSEGALKVALKNAELNQVKINFSTLDILNQKEWDTLPSFEIIVSNPPYVTPQEKSTLSPNVVNFEPSVALFVPENDPLLFYKVIFHFAQQKLNPGGKVYLEVNESYARDVSDYFEKNGWRTEILRDMYGKERMVKAIPT